MITRLWSPLQHRVSALPLWPGVAACVVAVGATQFGGPAAATAGWLLIVGFVLAAGARREVAYAAGPATAFVWLAAQFGVIGAVPSWPAAGAVLSGALGATLLTAPVGAALAPRLDTRRGRLLVTLAGPLLIAGAGADASAAWVHASVPLTGVAAAYAGLQVLVGVLVWVLWRQRATSVLALLACIGALFALHDVLEPGPASGPAPAPVFAIAFCAPVALVLADQGRLPPALGRGLAVACVVAALPVPAAALFGAIAAVASRAARDLEARVDLRGRGLRRALSTLPPYDHYYGRAKLVHDPLYDTLAERTGPWGAVLDIGCGMGLAGATVLERDPASTYTGVDLDPDKLAAAGQLLPHIASRDRWSLRCERFGHEPGVRDAPVETADTILILDVLHYVGRAQQVALLQEARARIAATGVALVRDAVRDGDAPGAVERGERWTTLFGLNPRGELTFHDEDGWRAVFAEAGFDVAASRPCGEQNVLYTLSPTPSLDPPSGEAGS